jgi:hypothetical protein
MRSSLADLDRPRSRCDCKRPAVGIRPNGLVCEVDRLATNVVHCLRYNHALARRGKKDSAPVDHSRLVDSFGEMRGRTHYEGFESNCAHCGARFSLTAVAQRHLHEQLGIPIKRAQVAGLCSTCRAAAGKTKRARVEQDVLVGAAERARAASTAKADHGGLLLEYVVAKLRVLEQSWSARSAEKLLGEVRRVGKLDPKLAKAAAKREAQLLELIEQRRV